jgi:hypothetical protein
MKADDNRVNSFLNFRIFASVVQYVPLFHLRPFSSNLTRLRGP